MTTVKDRLEQAPACKIIKLRDDEKHLYTGCGWRLARFVNGKLDALIDVEDAKSKNIFDTGEVYLVLCSCCELCEPQRVTEKTLDQVLEKME